MLRGQEIASGVTIDGKSRMNSLRSESPGRAGSWKHAVSEDQAEHTAQDGTAEKRSGKDIRYRYLASWNGRRRPMHSVYILAILLVLGTSFVVLLRGKGSHTWCNNVQSCSLQCLQACQCLVHFCLSYAEQIFLKKCSPDETLY